VNPCKQALFALINTSISHCGVGEAGVEVIEGSPVSSALVALPPPSAAVVVALAVDGKTVWVAVPFSAAAVVLDCVVGGTDVDAAVVGTAPLVVVGTAPLVVLASTVVDGARQLCRHAACTVC